MSHITRHSTCGRWAGPAAAGQGLLVGGAWSGTVTTTAAAQVGAPSPPASGLQRQPCRPGSSGGGASSQDLVALLLLHLLHLLPHLRRGLGRQGTRQQWQLKAVHWQQLGAVHGRYIAAAAPFHSIDCPGAATASWQITPREAQMHKSTHLGVCSLLLSLHLLLQSLPGVPRGGDLVRVVHIGTLRGLPGLLQRAGCMRYESLIVL
jgi:hypothetical protein